MNDITAKLLNQLAAQTRASAYHITAAGARIEAAERIISVLANAGVRANSAAALEGSGVHLHIEAFSSDDGIEESLALDPRITLRRHATDPAAGIWYDALLGGQSIPLRLVWIPADCTTKVAA